MRNSRFVAVTALVAVFCFLPVFSQLQKEETADLRIVFYDPNHSFILPHLERCFENALDYHKRFFDYQSKEKISVLLQDFGDFGHGGADSVPTNHISVGIAPFSYVYETMPANERMNWLMNHELVHVVICDKPAGRDRFFRAFFGGKVMADAADPPSILYTFLTNPRRYSPRWYHEGIAVFMETWMAGGLGRTLGGYDEMVFRTLVRDGGHIYDAVGLESEGTAIDFQVGVNSYLYGTRFMAYLAAEYGPDKLFAWVNRTEGSRAYFSSQFKEIYGRPLDEEWSAWIRFEQDWQRQNLSLLRQYPVTAAQPVTAEAVGSVSRPWVSPDGRTVYAAVRRTGKMAHLAAIDLPSGRIDWLRDLKGAALFYVTSLALDPSGNSLYFTTDNNYWRDLNVYDLRTGETQLLAKDVRAGDLAFNRADGSLWAVRHHNGLTTLIRFQPPYRFFSGVYTFPYGNDLFDIDISPDGRWLTGALADISGRQQLVRFELAELQAGKAESATIYDFEFSSPANFVFSPDGRYLVGTSYYTGVSNVFRFDTRDWSREVLSNSETGLFRPQPLPDGRLLAFQFSAQGFTPVIIPTEPLPDINAPRYLGQRIVERHPVVKNWKLGTPTAIDLEARRTAAGPYRPIREMGLVSFYPVVEGYKDDPAVGLRVDLMDNFGLAGLNATLSVTPWGDYDLGERFHFGAKFRYWNWKLSGGYNKADFYDLFGPTKKSRKGYFAKVEHSKPLIFDPPRRVDFEWSVAGYGGLERMPDFQNIEVIHPNFMVARASLIYAFPDKSLGAVDDEKGLLARADGQFHYAEGNAFGLVHGNLDYGFLLPIRNSCLWVRSSLGQAFGDHADPLGNFYFGGFGNNWVDYQSTSRYRDYDTFPGTELNEIEAANYGKLLLEWNLPPLRFKSWGRTWLYCNWTRLSLFSGGLLTNFDDSLTREFDFNLGAQLDFRVVLFSYLNTTFSIGYATRWRDGGGTSDEIMVSLKIL